MTPIGPFIRQRRKELGISQEQLAARVGIDRSHLSRIESSKVIWPESYIDAIARELDVTVNELGQFAARSAISTPTVLPVSSSTQSSELIALAHLRGQRAVIDWQIQQIEQSLALSGKRETA